MVEDNTEYEFRCPDCKWNISAEEIKRNTGFNEQFYFCELCGAKLIKYSVNEFDEITEIEQTANEGSKRYPVELIVNDPDFVTGFIDDLTLVLSRMIYVNIRVLEKSQKLDLESTEIDATLLNYIADTIMPILDSNINPLFLKKLKCLNTTDFESNLKKLHTKLEEIQIFRQNFIIYFRWLIKQVFILIAKSWNQTHLKKFDTTIIEDLKHYEFDEIFTTIEATKPEEPVEKVEFKEISEKFSKVINAQIDNLDQFKQFLQFTHGYAFIKEFIIGFNKLGNWIKDLSPTKKFIDTLKIRLKELKKSPSNLDGRNERILSHYVTLVSNAKQQNILSKAIKSLVSENKGEFNASDLQRWLLITEQAARNQLKRLFPNESYKEYIRTQKYVEIHTIEKIARKKGGKCHTKIIKNAKSELHLECAEGHHFHTTYNSVVYSHTWCPDCHIYVGEAICRQFSERIFKRPFPKSYPTWLVNEFGNQMELDGFCKELRLAFEYQGIQHRKKAFGLTDDDVRKIQQEDTYKLKKCLENHVILLQIPDDEIVPYDKMQDYIIQKYERRTNQTLKDVPKFDYHEFVIHENKPAKKFREYVENKGGTLITPYFSAKKEIKLMCEQGHEWTTTPNSIYMSNWCSVCAGNIKGTAEDFRGIGSLFECELISEYVNAKTPLTYRCKKGHKFKKDPYHLSHSYKKIRILCPKCQKEEFAAKFRLVIEKKGGKLLTPYKDRFKPVELICKNNHKWETTPAKVYQGNWCLTCGEENHPNKLRLESSKNEVINMLESLGSILLSDYKNNTKQIRIKCRKQHIFTVTPKYLKRLVNQHIDPCPKCRKENGD